MKRMAGVAIAVVLGVAVVAAQGTKTVRGSVAKTGPNAVTVKVGDRDMTFVVDSSTQVIARGGSTATRKAQAEGKPGTPYTDIVKAGQGVEVAYHESGMHAASIRVLPSVPPPPPPAATTGQAAGAAPKTMRASGVVSAVTGSSLTIKGSGGETTFVIDSKTNVIGRGAGTKAKAMKSEGQKTTIGDFVHTGDTVNVTYKEEGGAKHASQVRVTAQAKK